MTRFYGLISVDIFLKRNQLKNFGTIFSFKRIKMMNATKKYILILCFLCINFCIFAQKSSRIAFVDIDYILNNLEEYKVANEQFSEKVAQWQKEIDEKEAEIKTRQDKLNAEMPLLTPEMVSDRQEEISILQNALNSLYQKRFGAETGEYFVQKWQLAQPIQDQIFNIAQEIGKARKYDFIFTKEDASSIYAEERFDITKMVLRLLNRKENADDRNKDMSVLLKENYDYDLKDEKTKRKEEAERKRAEALQKRQAERQALIEKREQENKLRQEQRQKQILEKQKERERLLQEKKNKQQNQVKN